MTGAGRGIGRAIALSLAKNGSNVCISSRTLADIDSVAKNIKESFQGVRAFAVVSDVSDAADAERLVRSANDQLGSIDILVCAAGYPLREELWEKHLHELSDEDLRMVFGVDVIGSFNVAKHVLPLMVNHGGGSIVLFSSTPAIGGYDKGAPYTIAKAANVGLAKDIASEYGRYNIRCNIVAPGNIKTDKTFDRLSSKEKTDLAMEAAMKRWGSSEEVADTVAVLASDSTSFVTGQTIVIDGGTVML